MTFTLTAAADDVAAKLGSHGPMARLIVIIIIIAESIVLTIVVVIRMVYEIAHSTAPDVDNVIFPGQLSRWFSSAPLAVVVVVKV